MQKVVGSNPISRFTGSPLAERASAFLGREKGNISIHVEMLLPFAAMEPDACELLCLDLEKAEGLRRSRPPPAEAELLSEGYRALADPTRLTLAITLARTDELCVCDLAWISERSENLVSHHLRILRRAGLVSSRRDGKMVIYSIAEEGRHLLGALVSDLEAVN